MVDRPETDRATFVASFERQARICERLDSPFVAELSRRAAVDVRAGGPVWSLVRAWRGDPAKEVLPLRFAGALHFLALEGRAPALARYLPSLGGTPEWPAAWKAVCGLLGREAGFLRDMLRQPPQTNEVGRTAALLGGFLAVARETGRPLALREIGSSGGLIMRWDRYRYETDAFRWGDPDAPVVVKAKWHGPAPLPGTVEIVSRRGCDISPVDVTDPAARNRLVAYVWPDQLHRIEMLRAALDAAAMDPPPIDTSRAAEWLARQLDARPADAAFVLHHSFVWAYLDEGERAEIRRLMEMHGARAHAEAPLAWLRMEETEDGTGNEVRLTLWPDGGERRLALCHPHGRWIDWQGLA